MKLTTTLNDELMDVKKLQSDGNNLVIEGRIMGTMPVRAILTPDQARAALKLINFKTFFFLLTLLFRKSSKKS